MDENFVDIFIFQTSLNHSPTPQKKPPLFSVLKHYDASPHLN